MLNRLNSVNDVKVYSVFDDDFKTYGKIVDGFDFSIPIEYMENQTDIPLENNIYLPSDDKLEMFDVFKSVQNIVYGEAQIQVGYCNGKNSTYNGFEYHKGSEINIAVTDFMLVLGHIWQIKNNCFYVGDEKVFYVPEKTAVELYQTTLHLSPCKCKDSGFKNIVVLLKGTNTPLDKNTDSKNTESKLLLQKNKWVISHKDRQQLIKQGAFPGLIGENKELRY
ncbi:MAG: DUF4867 family protein [Clostridiales bacterium]|nr:DUF4867 family protein [Clostridiales bacterium]